MAIGLEELHVWAAYYRYDQLLTNIAGFVFRACRWVPGQRLGRTEYRVVCLLGLPMGAWPPLWPD